jgi:guanylate kinase
MEKEAGYLVVITGASGAGKDETTKKLCQLNCNRRRIVTFTNRPKRDNEVDGVDYNFVSRGDFENMIEEGQLAEYVPYRIYEDGSIEYKGTLRKDLENVLEGEEVIWRIDPTRAAEAKSFLIDKLGEEGELVAKRTLVVYVGVENLAVLKRRQKIREGDKFNKESFNKNLRSDWNNWLNLRNKYDLVVINRDGELDKTVEEIEMEINSRLNNK